MPRGDEELNEGDPAEHSPFPTSDNRSLFDKFGKNMQVKRVYWTLFVVKVGL